MSSLVKLDAEEGSEDEQISTSSDGLTGSIVPSKVPQEPHLHQEQLANPSCSYVSSMVVE